jgi:hypothetical protein
LAEFDVTVLTVRSGTRTLRVQADDASAARTLIQSECADDCCHCPAESCTDDIQSDVVEVRVVSSTEAWAPSSAPALTQEAGNRGQMHSSA